MKLHISMRTRKKLFGALFISPLIIGMALFFIRPLIQTIIYAFSTLKIEQDSMTVIPVGFKHFREALFVDESYVRTVVDSVLAMLYQTPVILLFSLYIAILLNQKFVGRWIFRVLFFIPVIAISGIVIRILNQDYLEQMIQSGSAESGLISVMDMTRFTALLNIPDGLLDPVISVVNDIFDLTWRSGIQILIFLAGLQTVPSSLYESAVIDGVTGWEKFWKITFPLITPMVFMNAIFTIVDNFTNSSNPVIMLIAQQSANMKMEYAAGLSLMYLLMVLVVIGVFYAVVGRFIVYLDDR